MQRKQVWMNRRKQFSYLKIQLYGSIATLIYQKKEKITSNWEKQQVMEKVSEIKLEKWMIESISENIQRVSSNSTETLGEADKAGSSAEENAQNSW